MPTKRKKNNWQHPLYKTGYVKNRDGNCQLVINHNTKQFRKSIPLAFMPQNRDIALSLLEEYIFIVVYHRTVKIDTLKEIFDKFMELKKDTLKKDSIKKYNQAFNSFLNDSVTTQDDVQKVILDSMIKSNLSSSSKNKQLTLLKGFFNFCIDNNYLLKNPITKTLIPKFKAKDIEDYREEEISKIIDFFDKKNKKIKQLIQLINYTGMRIQEAISFKLEDVKDGIITVKGKGDQTRFIPLSISPELNTLLQDFEPFTWKTYDYPSSRFKLACEELKINYLGFHGLRKSFENKLIQKEIPSDLVAEILGHTPEIQRKHYKKKTNAKQIKLRSEKYV